MNPDELFVVVVEEYQRNLLFYAQSFTHQEQDAEDAVQDGMLQIWRNPQRLQWSRQQLISAMFVVVRSRAIDGHRRRTSRRADPVHGAARGEAALASVADQRLSGGELQQSLEEVERIVAAVARLPETPPLRRVTELRLAGWSIDEIARELQCPRQSVFNWQFRAREHLRQLLPPDLIR